MRYITFLKVLMIFCVFNNTNNLFKKCFRIFLWKYLIFECFRGLKSIFRKLRIFRTFIRKFTSKIRKVQFFQEVIFRSLLGFLFLDFLNNILNFFRWLFWTIFSKYLGFLFLDILSLIQFLMLIIFRVILWLLCFGNHHFFKTYILLIFNVFWVWDKIPKKRKNT